MSSRRRRRHYTADEKAAILRKHFVDKKPISEICEEHKIQPSVFYDWQRNALNNLAAAVEPKDRKADAKTAELTRQVDALKAQVAKKDSVIAEISQEYVALKKEIGEP